MNATRREVAAVREAARVAGWSTTLAAEEIHRRCGVSRLRAYRLAMGWTLQDVADRIRAQAATAGQVDCRVGHPNVSRWETGQEHPSARNLDILCQVYQTRADRLGFGADYALSPPKIEPREPGDQAAATHQEAGRGAVDSGGESNIGRRELLRHTLAATAAGGLEHSLSGTIEETWRSVMDTLLSRSVTPSTVGWWEEQARHHATSYRTRPAAQLVVDVVLDLDELKAALRRRQPLDSQRRLTTVVAQLAGLLGILYVDLGHLREARRWFHAGQLAAEETRDRQLRAWLQTRESLAMLYHGSIEDAAAFARGARRLAGPNPSTVTAMAPAVEARALARMGRQGEALRAINHAERIFDKRPPDDGVPAVFGFTEAKLRFYQGNVLARTRDLPRATEAQQRALALCPAHDLVDRGHVQLDQALTLARQGELAEAYALAARLLLNLPPGPGLAAVAAQAMELRRSMKDVPGGHRLARDLDEVLASLPQSRGRALTGTKRRSTSDRPGGGPEPTLPSRDQRS